MPPAATAVKNSRRVVLIVVPRLSIGLMGSVVLASDRSRHRKAAIIGLPRAHGQGDHDRSHRRAAFVMTL